MKLLILQEKLKKGLNIIERISGKSISLPILSNVLIETKKNFLRLSSTDLEIGINWWGLVKTEKDGSTTIPINLLSNFLKLLPNKQIIIEKKDNFLNFECDNLNTQIKSNSPEDFPIIPEVSREEFIELDITPFCEGLEKVVDIASISQTKPEISGIYFNIQKDAIRATATDSFRLAEKTFLPKEINLDIQTQNKKIAFILPQKTTREIINIFKELGGRVKIYFSPNQILIENQMEETNHPQIQIVSRLIEGEYPSYEEIIPKKHQTQIIINKNEFLNQLKIAALFTGKINEIKLNIDAKKGVLEIFSQSPDLGEHHAQINSRIKGENMEISFNYKFLIDGLQNIKSPEVVFELKKEDEPALLKAADDPNYLYVVMPIMASGK